MSFWRDKLVQPSLDRDVQAAIAEQLAILKLDPTNPRAHFDLGTLRHFQGQTEAAIHCFLRAIELDSRYAAPHVSLGRIYVVRNQMDLAWKHAREAERRGDRSLVEQLARYPNLLSE